jgi:hypothetical protein
MQDNNSVNISESVKSDLTDITTEIAEAGFDQLLSDGFLKDIPVIGSVFKMLGIAKKVLDANFLNNILKFLYQLKEIPVEQRKEFVKKLEDKKQKKRLDQTLLVYLNRFENDRKATMLGNLFRAFIQGHINQSTFLRLSMSIDRAFVDDLVAFKNSTPSNEVPDETKRYLCDVGFYEEKNQNVTTNQHYLGKNIDDPPVTVSISTFYNTDYGQLFHKYG